MVINPAAGGGRCGRRSGALLRRLETSGFEVEAHRTGDRFEATVLAREAFSRGHRDFLAVGGDGTSFEVLNGALAPAIDEGETIRFGVLPLGTGNSFTQSFERPGRHGGSRQGVEQTLRQLGEGRTRALDVLRVHTDRGEFFALSFCAFGLSSRVADLCNRRLKWLGVAGYQLATFLLAFTARSEAVDIVLRQGDLRDAWRGRALAFGTHNTPLFGGALPIAPHADPADGVLDCVVIEDLPRLALLRALPSLRTGHHLEHPKVHTARAQRVDFQNPRERAVLLDGEIRRLTLHAVEVLPAVARFWI